MYNGANMNRRQFINHTAMAASALPFLTMPEVFRSMRMGIVVHSYAARWNSKVESAKYPAFKDAIDLLEHSHAIGAGGVQVGVRNWTEQFARKVRDRREALGLYLEGSIALPKTTEDLPAFESEIRAAKEAGATVVRTVCLNGRRYEDFQTLEAFRDFTKNAMASLRLAAPVVSKHKIKLAIENHKDWRAPELREIMKKLDSEWVGVNIDFGNNVALIEDPMEVVTSLAPFVFSTHVKDMGVKEYADGFLLSEVPLGEGFLNLKEMFDVCRRHNPNVTFNLEMITRDPLKIPCLTKAFWQTLPTVTADHLATTLKTIRDRSFKSDLPVVSPLSSEERLAVEEQNILTSLSFSQQQLGLH